ncbi:OmpA family protein [Nonlabens xiamenensis]|uniref:OmpA family protein n=1 Tax=Nonlabens xiamenensis TaxID=2341043 RepID=UPI001F0CB0E9|nr:OmpA family protein [Nonlabens xiamenensis]
MKKLLTLTLLMCAGILYAQETENMEPEMNSDSSNFKRWAIDLGAGVHKPTRPFASSAFTNTPDLFQVDLGVRYMFTRSFGIGLEFGYNDIQSDEDSPIEFETKYYRTTLEGIVNLGNFVNLDAATSNFGIIGHGGMGIGFLPANDDFNPDGGTDLQLNFQVGITPQLRLADNVALFGDLTVIGTVRNDYGWDGLPLPNATRGFEGLLVNASVGISFYLGNGNAPADFAKDPLEAKVDEVAEAMDQMAREYADDDKDGVPNYIDRDNTTESGVRVDNKGRAIDLNKNGIPDDMESALDSRYASQSDVQTAIDGANASNGNLIKQLINEGYVNVYFRFNSTKPTTYSLGAVNTIMQYMNDNPSATATLTGYADEIGSPEYNKDLSERRAKMVHDVLVAAGIDASRLSYNGDGEDASVDKNSSDARQLVRRVTFRVN